MNNNWLIEWRDTNGKWRDEVEGDIDAILKCSGYKFKGGWSSTDPTSIHLRNGWIACRRIAKDGTHVGHIYSQDEKVLAMINWHETINIAGLHRLFTSGSISLQDLGRAVVVKLKNTNAFASCEPELVDIICAFEAIDELASPSDYRAVLDMLYDFGDKNHALWIETESPSMQDDIPNKTRNPYEDINNKEPYLSPAAQATEWVNVLTAETTESAYSKDKMYKVGEVVIQGCSRYRCLVSCAGVDPAGNSRWKWLNVVQKNFDPTLIFKDRITCATPENTRVYPPTRKYHYMSDDDFSKKLAEAGINSANLSRELYFYMKDCEEPYQDWLISRFNNGNMTFKQTLQDSIELT